VVNRLRYLFTLVFLVSALFCQNAWAAAFSASVDRKNISENDTFSLMLRYGEQVGFGSPDLTPLERDFQVLNQQRSNQFRSINGRNESFTEWTLTLSPKRTGKLTIPTISFKNKRTQTITMNVSALSAAVKKQLEKEFFFDVEISKGPYYVQGQILYKEKLFYSVNHEDPSLSDFKVTDARVEPLSEVRSYQTVVDGQRLGVYERQYAIFPEESGNLVIPGQRFNARVTNPYDRWSRGRQAGIVSKPVQLEVKPIPANYPQAPWLPASRLEINETFSNGDQSQWTVGEPVTRTIKVTASGLSGSQIPAIALPVVDKIRYYPDQSDNSERMSETGIQGTLQQSMAIVPTAEGRLVLPEVRIPWWNTRLGILEYAVLPARTILVKPATIAQPETIAPALNNAVTPANNTGTITGPANGYWIIASCVLFLSNLILVYLLWRQKNRVSEPPESLPQTVSDKQRWKELKQACQQNDAQQIRTAVIHWTSAYFKREDIVRLDQIQALHNNHRLSAALAELDALLYASNSTNSAFNGANLLALLKTLKPDCNNQNANALKPLYS
jgi:hypothetical protein